MPAKIPSTACVVRLRMKLLTTRDVYWLEASERATRVIEKVMPTTVIIELAIVDSISRAPSAPAPNSRGHLCNISGGRLTSIRHTASTMLLATISDGRNQKLDRS